MKISEAFALYKNHYLIIKRLSKRVLEDNDYVAERLIKVVGDKDIEQLTMDDVAEWARSITTRTLRNGKIVNRAENTIRNDVIRLRVVLKYLCSRGCKCLNYELIPVPKHQDVVKQYLTPEEVNLMLENSYNLRNKFIISLLYSSGIRLSEFLALNRDSIQNRRFTVIGKGKKTRLCFIDERTEELMNNYLSTRQDDCKALVISRINKDRMTPSNVQLLVKNAAKRAGITKKVTPHTLRHSFATNFISNNGNIRHLSTLMGHASVDTTLIYTHLSDNELEYQYRTFHSISTKTDLKSSYPVYYTVDNQGHPAYN